MYLRTKPSSKLAQERAYIRMKLGLLYNVPKPVCDEIANCHTLGGTLYKTLKQHQCTSMQ